MTKIETTDATELNDSELDEVNGAGLLKFIIAIAYPGQKDPDPAFATHTQLWVVTAS